MSNNYQRAGHSNKDVTTAVVTAQRGAVGVVVQEARKLSPSLSLKILEQPFEFLCGQYEFQPIFFSPAISKVHTPNHDVRRF